MKVREDLLPGLLRELEKTRRRRVVRRRAASTVAALTIAIGAVLMARFGGPATQAPHGSTTKIEFVATRPSVLERYLAAPRDPAALIVETRDISLARIQMLSDRELLDVLADAGRPTAIARSGGRTWLLADVTDDLSRGGG